RTSGTHHQLIRLPPRHAGWQLQQRAPWPPCSRLRRKSSVSTGHWLDSENHSAWAILLFFELMTCVVARAQAQPDTVINAVLVGSEQPHVVSDPPKVQRNRGWRGAS